MRKGPAPPPESSTARAPHVLVQRALPTEPTVRGSVSPFLVEGERRGIEADRRMLCIDLNRSPSAPPLACESNRDRRVRRKLMLANGASVRIVTSYFRADLFGETYMVQARVRLPILYAATEALGYRFRHSGQNLTAHPSNEFERTTLELGADEGIVQVLRQLLDRRRAHSHPGNQRSTSWFS